MTDQLTEVRVVNRMSKLTRRKLIDAVITFAAIHATVTVSGSGWLGVGVVLFGLWNYYDGMSRQRLSK